MISLKRILVPTDFSETSDAAVKYAVALAEAFHASLHVVHVVEDSGMRAWGSELYVPVPVGLLEQIERDARQALEKMFGEEERRRRGMEITVLVGNAFLEIVQYAKKHEMDLIVMGTHGRGPVAHMLMGSVAEKVVRKAPCPVLTVKHPQHEFVMP